MINQLHIHPKVEKRLMDRPGPGARQTAADRARRIIQSLKTGTPFLRAGPLSRSKEARVKHVFKYNLGSGFRLIGVKKKMDLYLLFMGDHDQCDRWLDIYRKKKPADRNVKLKTYPIHPVDKPMPCTQPLENRELQDMVLTQKQLRWVFKGLVQNTAG